MKCKVIGLTGPIASGKDEVAKVLRSHRVHVVDADEVGHGLLFPQSDVWKKLVKTFGSKILLAGGRVNRRRLGEMVFGNPKFLKKLNMIMHPRIKDQVKLEIRKWMAESSKLLVVNAAVLKEIGLIPLVDEVWVVMAGRKKRLSRLIKKGMSRKLAEARMAAQEPEKRYIAIADKVIKNDGSKSALRRVVLRLINLGL